MFTRKDDKKTVDSVLDAARKKNTVSMDSPSEIEEKPKAISYQPLDEFGAVYSPYFHGYRSTYRV